MFCKSILSGVCIVILLLLYGCNSSDQNEHFRHRPASTAGKKSFVVDYSDSKGEFSLGDTVIFSVKPSHAEDSITKVEIYTEGSTIPVAEGQKPEWRLATTSLVGGKSRLRIIATFASGETSTRYKDLFIKAPLQPVVYNYKVINKFPHDPGSYTQGLLFHNGYLYEGTGQYGKSVLRKLDLVSGKVLQETPLDKSYFGEGVTVFGDKIYQVTYRAGKCFVYDLNSLELINTFSYKTETGEGWGLTSNDTALIMSDGSSWLYFRNPETFEEMGRMQVFTSQGNQKLLNELEYYNGKLYANVYTEPYIAIIEPTTGVVEAYINLSGILSKDGQDTRRVDVLNGIAINPVNGNLIITGKYWPAVYEIVPVKER